MHAAAIVLALTETLLAAASGPIALSADGELLAVANPDSGSVSLVATATRELLAEIPVGGSPQAVAIDAVGGRTWITDRSGDAVVLVDLAARRRVAAAAVGDEPWGVVAAADGRVFVAASGAGAIDVLDGATLARLARAHTDPGPRGLALSPGGSELYVTHLASGRLTIVDTATLAVVAVVSTGPDSNLAQGIAIDSERGLAYLPHSRSNSTNPAPLFDTTIFPVVSVVDLAARRHLPALRLALDVVDQPVNLPLAAALTAAGVLFVLNAGSNDLSVIDLATRRTLAHVEVGDHPRGLVLSPDEHALYVSNALAGTVSIVDTESRAVVGVIAVTEIPLPPDVLRGKILFNSSDRPELARDQWVSCASCHFDGAHDSRTWSLADGPRSTPALLGLRDTLPLHWSGDLDEVHDVERTVRTLQAGTGLAAGSDHCDPACDQGPPNAGRSADLDALGAYLRSLAPVRNPNQGASGELTAPAARGQALFLTAETGCAECHPPPLYTDRSKHDVGTSTSALEARGSTFDTPSLRGVHATAPYFHDGSVPTLLDVLTSPNAGDLHGKTSHLGADEIGDLVEFLRSLPLVSEICVSDADTACLLGGRFAVEGAMEDFSQPPSRFSATVMSFPDGRGETEQAAFFESFDRGNFEVAVKMVNGCSLAAGHPLRAVWAFFGGLTNARVEIAVEDTATGAIYRWINPGGDFPLTAGDTGAFPCASADAALDAAETSVCRRDDATACLLSGRFRVSGSMQYLSTSSAVFPARVMAFPSGRAETHQTAVFDSFDRGTFEVGVKMIDACALPAGHPLRAFWVFYGGLTNARTEISVTHLATGSADAWVNPAGAFSRSEVRTSAFPCE